MAAAGQVGGHDFPAAPGDRDRLGFRIGRATAVALAAADMDITWHTDEASAQGTAAEVRRAGGNAELARLDTSELTSCGDVMDVLADRLGGVDVFVNNAGTGSATPALDMTIEQWRHIIATDLDGAFACIQRAARRMVTVAAAAGSSPSPACTNISLASDRRPMTRPSTASAA